MEDPIPRGSPKLEKSLDIFQACSQGDTRYVRQFLDNVSNDLNEADDHGFTPLHWSSRDGHPNITQMLVARGARVNARNDGGDTPLHLACAHGHVDVVAYLLKCKANINLLNEHGNTPLHYACFINHAAIALELVRRGAYLMQCNRYDETPLQRAPKHLGSELLSVAQEHHQKILQPIKFEEPKGRHVGHDYSTLKSMTSSAIEVGDVHRTQRMSETVSGVMYKGVWNNIVVVAKMLKVYRHAKRLSLQLNEEYPRLRIFSHPNVLPVITAVAKRPDFMIVSQYMQYGSLHDMLHQGHSLVVNNSQTIKFALDVAQGMAYMHSLNPVIKRFSLNSFHVVIDEDLTARISMQDVRYSFQDDTKLYRPNWMSPEDLREPPATVDRQSADMWSFAIILWELATRAVPYADLSPMDCGMKIATEECRPPPQPGMSQHLTKLMAICWNTLPKKRPRFDQVVPILEKMEG